MPSDITGVIAGQVVEAYGGYAGEIEVSWSRVGYQLTEDGVLTLDVADLVADPICFEEGTDSGAANSCGFHVHENVDCSDAGGHYWTDDQEADPWANIVYGRDMGTAFTLEASYQEDSEGRALVVHDRTGARIACTFLETTAWTSSYSHSVGASDTLGDIGYPDYAESIVSTFDEIEIESTVAFLAGDEVLVNVDPTVVISYTNLAADASCTGVTSDAANSCGIHLHSGSSCAVAAEVGGHFYNSDNFTDPWLIGRYVHGESGAVVAVGVEYFQDRVLVVHDITGARISCVELPPAAPTTAPVATPTTAPTTDAPTTDAPTTDAPTTDAPTTDAPTDTTEGETTFEVTDLTTWSVGVTIDFYALTLDMWDEDTEYLATTGLSSEYEVPSDRVNIISVTEGSIIVEAEVIGFESLESAEAFHVSQTTELVGKGPDLDQSLGSFGLQYSSPVAVQYTTAAPTAAPVTTVIDSAYAALPFLSFSSAVVCMMIM